jgi:hypothetical protein
MNKTQKSKTYHKNNLKNSNVPETGDTPEQAEEVKYDARTDIEYDDVKSFSETRPKGFAKAQKTESTPVSLLDLIASDEGFNEHAYLESCCPSPFENLNKAIQGGFRSGHVYSFFGHAGAGKSTFLMRIMAKLAQTDMESLNDNSYSYLYLDKEQSSKQFYSTMMYGGGTIEDLKKPCVHMPEYSLEDAIHTPEDVAEQFPTLFHMQFDESHQKGYYYSRVSFILRNLPYKNVRVIFVDGCQDSNFLEELKEIAMDFDCIVITTTATSKNHGQIPDRFVYSSTYCAAIRRKAEVDLKDEPEGTHRLYIIKSRFLNNNDFTGFITYKTPYGKKVKKSNYLLFDIKPEKIYQSERVVEKGTLLDTLSPEDIISP